MWPILDLEYLIIHIDSATPYLAKDYSEQDLREVYAGLIHIIRLSDNRILVPEEDGHYWEDLDEWVSEE